MQVKLTTAASKGRSINTVEVPADSTVQILKRAVLSSRVGLQPSRQRLTIAGTSKPLVLEDGKTLSSYGIKDGSTVTVKDIGPQISWRTVFILEYLGPLLIHQAVFFYRFNTTTTMLFTQILAYACITFHFAKREYESIFIHRFSNSTMPVANLFKNSFHYWALSGVMLSYYLYTPDYVSPAISTVLLALPIFIAAELGNFYSHIVLRDLRPAGSNVRGIPRGFGFDLVSCPNYTFEILAWASLSLMTGLFSMWIFTIISGSIMAVWALKKHRRYRRDFADYPKSRKAIIPFIL